MGDGWNRRCRALLRFIASSGASTPMESLCVFLVCICMFAWAWRIGCTCSTASDHIHKSCLSHGCSHSAHGLAIRGGPQVRVACVSHGWNLVLSTGNFGQRYRIQNITLIFFIFMIMFIEKWYMYIFIYKSTFQGKSIYMVFIFSNLTT